MTLRTLLEMLPRSAFSGATAFWRKSRSSNQEYRRVHSPFADGRAAKSVGPKNSRFLTRKLFDVKLSLAAEVNYFFAGQESPIADGARSSGLLYKLRVADLVGLRAPDGGDDSRLREIGGDLRGWKCHLLSVRLAIRGVKSFLAAKQVGEVRFDAGADEHAHDFGKSELSGLRTRQRLVHRSCIHRLVPWGPVQAVAWIGSLI